MLFKYLGEEKFFKTSTNTGLFYEFVDSLCDVLNEQDIEYFSNHKMYQKVETKKVKKGVDE